MPENFVAVQTGWLRHAQSPYWSRVRSALVEHGMRPSKAVLADWHADDAEQEYLVVACEGRAVSLVTAGPDAEAIQEWTELTERLGPGRVAALEALVVDSDVKRGGVADIRCGTVGT